MSKEIHLNSHRCSLVINSISPFAKYNNISRGVLSTVEDTLEINIPSHDNYNKLFQQYVHCKQNRKKSGFIFNLFLLQGDVLLKGKEAASTRMSFIQKRLNKKAKGRFNLKLEKRDLETFRSIKTKQVENLHERNSKTKRTRDYSNKTWKERIKVNNNTQAFQSKIIKHNLDSERLVNKFNQIIKNRETCLEQRIERVFSAEKKLKNKLIKRNYQVRQLKHKLCSETQLRKDYNKEIIQYEYENNMLSLDLEKTKKENAQCLKRLFNSYE